MIDFKGVEFAPDFTVKHRRNIAEAQDIVDRECLKLLPDYTPIAKKSYPNWGKMSRSHKRQSPGVIINTEPLARREYYTNKGGSGRGKFWLDRLKADHRDDILRSVKKR